MTKLAHHHICGGGHMGGYTGWGTGQPHAHCSQSCTCCCPQSCSCCCCCCCHWWWYYSPVHTHTSTPTADPDLTPAAVAIDGGGTAPFMPASICQPSPVISPTHLGAFTVVHSLVPAHPCLIVPLHSIAPLCSIAPCTWFVCTGLVCGCSS